jgi:hypothetical protein
VIAGLAANVADRSVIAMALYFGVGALAALLVVGFFYVLSRPSGF